MQTVEPYVELQGEKRPGGRGPVWTAVVLIVVVLASVAAIESRLGVIVVVALAFVALVGAFVLRKGFEFPQLVAFLIHFDGLGQGGITIGRILSACAVILMIHKLLVDKWRPPAIPPKHWIPPLALVTWAIISGGWSAGSSDWFLHMGILGLALAYFATAALLVDSYEKVERFLRAFWYGGVCGSIVGINGLVLGFRSYGFGSDSNFFGLLEASMIPLTVYYRRQARTPREKWMYSVVVLLVLGGAAGSGSRSGVIGAAVAIFATIVFKPGQSLGQQVLSVARATVLAGVVFVVLLFANPATYARGVDSSGRLDFWKVTVELVKERPLIGHGLGQVPRMIPGRLPTTPGAEKLKDSRNAVSSHNTWLDITADLGVVGLTLFTATILVAMVSLLRPRWKQTKQLSMTLFVMMLPAMSSSMLLPLVNNKLLWSLVGLAAALQVPSWGNRYKGYFAPQRAPDGAPGMWQETRLARWDLKVSQRFRGYILLGALVGAVSFAAVTSRAPNEYVVTTSLVVPELDASGPGGTMRIDVDRVQTLHTLVLSTAYAAELQNLSGIDRGIPEIQDAVSVERPRFGAYMKISYTDTDKANPELVGPYLIEALDAVIDKGRLGSTGVLEDELRPMYPGEQRYYSGPLFLPISDVPSFSVNKPRTTWPLFVGALSGAMVAVGFTLAQQRRPRVNNDDDYPTAVGMDLWTHVGRNGRRNAASPAQYAQVAVVAFEATDSEQRPRRMLVAGPHGNRSTRHLAMGVAASLAASGERVLLVDGQAERPLVSWRLGAGRKAGLQEVMAGDVSLDRAIHRVRRWRLPRTARRTLGTAGENLRLIPAGRAPRGSEPAIDPKVLESLDDRVIAVMLAPPLLGTLAAGPCIRWADVLLYCLVEGQTVTFDAEDASVQVHTFSTVPYGVVLADV